MAATDPTPKVTGIRRARPRSAARFSKRRDEIIDTAASVFARRGFHATSIDDLSEATGLQRGGLYYYIGSKDALLIRIHERFIGPLLEEARSIVARNEPPDVELQLLADALLRDIVSYQDQVTVFLHEWRLVADTPEWQEVRKARKEFETIIANCVKRGQHAGIFRRVDVSLTMRGFLGMINYTYMWLRPGGRTSAAKVSETFSDIFLHGILSEPGLTTDDGSGAADQPKKARPRATRDGAGTARSKRRAPSS